MNLRNAFFFVSLATLCLANAACAQKAETAPKISISPTRVPANGWVNVQGIGFTPNHNISSHLRRPDGSEYPVLPILTNNRGEFKHDIDTLLMATGTCELWVVDDATNVSSNVARFEVTRDQPPR